MSDHILERQYSECRTLITDAIVAGLRFREPVISKSFPYSQPPGPKRREVSGIGVFVDEMGRLLLYLRSYEEGLPGSVVAQDLGAREHCILDSMDEGLPLAVTRYCEWIESWLEPDDEVDPIGASETMLQAVHHLLAMAAAEALISANVRDELRRHSISLGPVGPEGRGELEACGIANIGWQFVVRDRMEHFTCNYCDLVAAYRYTDYVLSGKARRDAKRELADEARFQEEEDDFFRDTGVRLGEQAAMSQLRAWLRWVIGRRS